MIRKLMCKLGLHELVAVDFKDKNYRDSKHGWIEQNECKFCGYRTSVREYY